MKIFVFCSSSKIGFWPSSQPTGSSTILRVDRVDLGDLQPLVSDISIQSQHASRLILSHARLVPVYCLISPARCLHLRQMYDLSIRSGTDAPGVFVRRNCFQRCVLKWSSPLLSISSCLPFHTHVNKSVRCGWNVAKEASTKGHPCCLAMQIFRPVAFSLLDIKMRAIFGEEANVGHALWLRRFLMTHLWPWSTKPVISSTVSIANNTLYGSKL